MKRQGITHDKHEVANLGTSLREHLLTLPNECLSRAEVVTEALQGVLWVHLTEPPDPALPFLPGVKGLLTPPPSFMKHPGPEGVCFSEDP